MSLQAEIEKLKQEIEDQKAKEEGLLGEEIKEVEPIESEALEEKQEPEEEKSPEPIKEELKEVKSEETLDNSAYARMRREAAAAKKLAEQESVRREQLEAEREQLKRELDALRNRNSEFQEHEQSASIPQVPNEINEIIESHKFTKAQREFQSLENDFKAVNPDYDNVAAQYAQALAQSIKIQNPRMSQDMIIEQTKKTILLKASDYLNKGFNPIEELYHEAKDLGFGKIQIQQEAPKEEVRPDMKKLAVNRARSSGMAAAAGKFEGMLTAQAAAEMTAGEWSKLTPEQKRQILPNL